jgi:hypothetical protein
MPSFRRDLGLAIIDKLVLGGLVLAAGFVLNGALQRHQSQDAFKSEITKIRVQKIGDVWSNLDEEDAVVHDFVDTGGRYLLTKNGYTKPGKFGYTADDLKTQWVSLYHRYKSLDSANNRLLERNQFWIGENDLYPQYEQFYEREQQTVDDFLRIALTNDIGRLKHLRKSVIAGLNAKRTDIVALMQSKHLGPLS